MMVIGLKSKKKKKKLVARPDNVDVGDDEIMRINNKDANFFHSLDRFCFGQKILYLSLFFSFTHHYLIYHDDYLV